MNRNDIFNSIFNCGWLYFFLEIKPQRSTNHKLRLSTLFFCNQIAKIVDAFLFAIFFDNCKLIMLKKYV